jgi:hypothetical protein
VPANILSTASSVGGRIGRPSVQPLEKYRLLTASAESATVISSEVNLLLIIIPSFLTVELPGKLQFADDQVDDLVSFSLNFLGADTADRMRDNCQRQVGHAQAFAGKLGQKLKAVANNSNGRFSFFLEVD